MKYKTITFDANYPTPRQITEPLDSDYGIAVKVYKDNEPVDASKVKIGDNIGTEGSDGWKLFELSSDSNDGMKTVEVEVTEGGGGGGVSYTKSVEGFETFINNEQTDTFWWFGANELSASDGSALPETLTLDARKISGSFVATGTDGYSLSGTFPQEAEDSMCFPLVATQDANYVILNNNGEYTWVSFTAGSEEPTIVGPTITISTTEEDYVEIDGCFIYDPDGIPTKQIDISVNANISFGTDGGESGESSETIKFPLYVQQKDLGYIEVNDSSSSSVGGDITII